MIPRGCRCKGLLDLRSRLAALLFAGLGHARSPGLSFPSGTMSARNSPDNPCRGRASARLMLKRAGLPRRLVALVRRGLSLPIHLYSVTDRFDKRHHITVILLNN